MSSVGGDGGRKSKPVRGKLKMSVIERVLEGLTDREWGVIHDLHKVHIATGSQLERLHFYSLPSKRSRNVVRGLALKQLVDDRVLTTFDRRVRVPGRDLRELCYALYTNGYRVLQIRANRETPEVRVRRPWTPGDRFVQHTLAITELYVELMKLARLGEFTLAAFQAKGEARWPDGLGGWLGPDAFIRLQHREVADYWQYWWYEADMGSESLPTLKAKLSDYLDFVRRGQLGPDSIVPRVIVGVLAAKRQTAIEEWLAELSAPAAELFRVAAMSEVAHVMANAITAEPGAA